jgi:hypothetical protein
VNGDPGADPDFKFDGLDPRPRRALAGRILAVLEYHGVSYGVLRDPSRLFDEGLGDLDLWVPARSMRSAMVLIEREAEMAGWWLLKRVQRPYVSTVYLYRPGQPPSALTIDAFPAIRWMVADLLPEALLAESRIRTANAWVIDPRVSALASCLHHLAWNERVAGRYLEAYLRVDDGEDLPYSGLVQRMAKDPTPPWRKCRRRLLTSAMTISIVMHPIRALRDALSTVASLGRSSPGRWIAIDGPMSTQYLAVLDRRLHEEHFLVGRWGSIGRVPNGKLARAGWYTRNVLVKRWFGAIVLSTGDPGNLGADARIRAARSGWQVDGDAQSSAAAQGEHVDGLFQYLLTWLAAEYRIEASESRRMSGVVVGLVGQSESAKSSLAEHLVAKEGLQPAARYQVSPRVLQQLTGNVTADKTRSDQRPRAAKHRWLMSLVRFAWCWWTTRLRFATVIRRMRSAGLVVLVEQSFLDVLVDPTHYGFRLPGWTLELAGWASPKPLLLLYLPQHPGETVARDAQLSPRKPVGLGRAFRLVDLRDLNADAGPDDLARQATEVINGARGTA